jgi:hypothetical protein
MESLSMIIPYYGCVTNSKFMVMIVEDVSEALPRIFRGVH